MASTLYQPVSDPVQTPAESQRKQWFRNNHFHNSEFQDLDQLVERKHELDTSISVGLPTLDEEGTIGDIIRKIRKPLQEKHDLVDEIAIIDSGSSDETLQIAEREGAKVYQDQNHTDKTGGRKGKGVNLWLSLSLLEGDLICWVDADIRNFDPKFIYGLIGPLLLQDEVEYVKGFYERPIEVEGDLHASGGGRVTELTARPMLNLFFPELQYFVQPLSGEYAGSRNLLEKMPFFPEYGVETGLLMDIVLHEGLEKTAQVNLDRRVHENKPLSGLREMAFQILHVGLLRAQQHGRISSDVSRKALLKKINQKGMDLELDSYESEVQPFPPQAQV